MSGTIEAWRRARTLLPAVGLMGGLVGMAGMAACGGSDGDITGVHSATLVFVDPTFNFGTLRTFTMPESVVQVPSSTGIPIPVTRLLDTVILNRVRQDFLARGFTQVVNPAITRPDFVVQVSVTTTPNFNPFVTFPWFSVFGFGNTWSWYVPGFDNTWGIVFPFGPVDNITTLATGSIVVELIPTLSVNATTHTIAVQWAGVAAGLLNPADIDDATSLGVVASIDEMFFLSPYLVPVSPVPLVSKAP